MFSPPCLRRCLSCGLSFLVPASLPLSYACAQTQPSVTLEAISVQGDVRLKPLPPGSTITDYQAMRKRSITDWDDFARRADLSVQFNPTNKSINLRGTDGDRVVTRIDGIRVPWISDGARGVDGGLNTVAFSSLSAIDVLGGAAALRSGSVSGLIDLHTLSPDDLLAPDSTLGALANSGYDSADRSWRADASLAGRLSDSTRWLLHFGLRQGHERRNMGHIGGYGAHRSRINPQDYRQHNVLLKLHHDIDAQHRLELSGERFRHRADIDNRRAQGPDTSYEFGHNQTQETTARDLAALGYRYQASAPSAMLQEGHLKAYWQRMQLKSDQQGQRIPDARGNIMPGDPFRYRYPFGPFTRENRIRESGIGLVTEWSGRIEQSYLQHTWTMGVDGYRSDTKQASDGFDNCPAPIPGLPAPLGPRACDLLHTGQSDMPKVKGKAWSLWVENEMSWSGNRFSLTPALRFDSYHYRPQADDSYESNPNAGITALSANSAHRFSPSLLASFRPSEHLRLYASYAHGFKAPNASQLYLNYGAPGTYLSVGNPRLQPETSQGVELGLEAGDTNLNGQISVFHNRYKNFIDAAYPVTPDSPHWNPAWDGLYPMGVTTAINRARVRIFGVEAKGHWQINNHWHGRAALVWTRGKDLEAGTPLNSIAPLKANIAIAYEQPQWGAQALFTAALRHRRVEQDDDFQAPGYGIADLTAWWTPSHAQGLRLQAGVYNLFDKKYWDALHISRSGRDAAPMAYYTESGRSFRISLSYQY